MTGGANITVNLEYNTASTNLFCLYSSIDDDSGLVEEVGTTEAVLVGQTEVTGFFCPTLPW